VSLTCKVVHKTVTHNKCLISDSYFVIIIIIVVIIKWVKRKGRRIHGQVIGEVLINWDCLCMVCFLIAFK